MKLQRLFLFFVFSSLFAHSQTVKLVDQVLPESMSLLPGSKMTEDTLGKKVFFLGIDRKLYYVDLAIKDYPTVCISDLTKGGFSPAANLSGLIYFKWSVYFIDQNNTLCHYYYSSGNWLCSSVSAAASKYKAAGAICMNASSTLFFNGINGQLFCYSQIENSSNLSEISCLTQPILLESDLCLSGNQLNYVGKDKNLYKLVFNESECKSNSVETVHLEAQTGTTIQTDAHGNLYYCVSSNQNWKPNENPELFPLPIKTRLFKLQNSNQKIWYIDQKSNRLEQLSYTKNEGWKPISIFSSFYTDQKQFSVKAKSDFILTSNNDIIYCSSADNKLHLLSPMISWKTTLVASGLNAFINLNGTLAPSPEISISRTACPANYQFYPRDSSGYGTVVCQGTALGYNDITFKITKTNFFGSDSSWINPSILIDSTGNFSTAITIKGELSEYKILYKLSGQVNFTELASHVVCGDAFIASGQSNMAAADGELNQCALNAQFGANSDYGRYSRTFGDNLTECRNWGNSTANNGMLNSLACTNPVGALILALQYKIQKEYKIPTCVLNNALGGTTIDQHLLNPNDKFYFEYQPSWGFKNSEGHLIRRVYAAGLENNIKGFFWYQGEHDARSGYTTGLYKQKFKQLYDGLAAAIPSLSAETHNRSSITELFQIQSLPNNCPWSNMVSEDQRTIAASIDYAHIHVIATNGVKFPNCNSHYTEAGYEELANRAVSRLVLDYFKDVADSASLSPEILEAKLHNNQMELIFNQELFPDDSVEVLNAISLSNGALKSNLMVKGKSIFFNVSSSDNLNRIGYLGCLPAHNSAVPVYSSPGCPTLLTASACVPTPSTFVNSAEWWSHAYLRNAKGMAPLSFYNYPIISDEKKNEIKLSEELVVCPNPTSSNLSILSTSPILEIRILNEDGMLLLLKEMESTRLETQFNMSLQTIPDGIYFAWVKTTKMTVRKKFILVH